MQLSEAQMNRRDAKSAETGQVRVREHLITTPGTSPSALFSALIASLRLTPHGRPEQIPLRSFAVLLGRQARNAAVLAMNG